MDRARFLAELRRFDPERPVEESCTPPSSWYTERQFFEREARSSFRRHWIAVARSDQVASPGQFCSGQLLGEPWLVLRDEEGRLRAFSNVCSHHAAPVVSGSGSLERLVCPYHGWTYDLRGRLRKAPRLGQARDFHPRDFGLDPLAVCESGPLVFLCFAARPPSLSEQLADIPALLDRSGLDDLRWVETRSYDLRCNWKVFIDNYLDGGYHVAALHADLAGRLDLDSYRTELRSRAVIQTCGGVGDARVGDQAFYAWVHPNLCVNRYGPVLDTNLVLPLSEDRTRVLFDFWFESRYAEDGPKGRAFIAECLRSSEQVQSEDIAICEAVQTGLGSRAYESGRYAPSLEHGAHHFHRLLAGDLRGALEEWADTEREAAD